MVQPGVKPSDRGSQFRSQPLPSTALRGAREAALAQRGQGLAQGHPAVSLLPPRPGLFHGLELIGHSF